MKKRKENAVFGLLDHGGGYESNNNIGVFIRFILILLILALFYFISQES